MPVLDNLTGLGMTILYGLLSVFKGRVRLFF